jgi:hypothetical protein
LERISSGESRSFKKPSFILSNHCSRITILGERIRQGFCVRLISSMPKVVFPAPGAATICIFLFYFYFSLFPFDASKYRNHLCSLCGKNVFNL